MTYDHELILIGSTITKDEIAQEIETPTYTTILCGLKSISRNEFYAAAKAGLKPSVTFIVHGYEYEAQEKVKFEGKEYKIMRTYAVNFEELELICERIGSNG